MNLRIVRNLFLILFIPGHLFAQNTIDLSGKWEVKLEVENEKEIQLSEHSKTSGPIDLPGSLAENGFGFKTTGSDFGILTPEYKYIGKAWYKKQIEIPKAWEHKKIEIFLERVLWESRIFLDGIELSKQDALGTPHIHKLGGLTSGKHELVVLVNNEMIHNIGDKGHAYGEYTQSIWNGIVGRMEMNAKDATSFLRTNIYSDIQKEEIVLKGSIESQKAASGKIEYEVISVKDNESVLSGSFYKELKNGETFFEQKISTEGKLKLWNEFNPEVYTIKLYLKSVENRDFREVEFGFYELTHNGTKMLVNGNPIFLRGNLDCVHFPLTGYVSCELDDWIKIFKTYKTYGLNHARFHSWCPPEAAFKAANRVGIYLQAEASIWIDWWMSTNMIDLGRPERDTKGHPKGLGHDPLRDKFVVEEMNRVVDTYGNNPSFTMFCIGNELGNSNFDIMKEWVAEIKEKDPRRLYAISTARTITEIDDYSATHYIKDVGRTRGLNGAHTDWNFEEAYSQMNIPIIAHEIGQWPVYPRWSEIAKYTGVLKARNFEEFKLQAEKNGIVNQSDEFADASGALNQIMYKYEIESFLRTPSCAGIQLLSMQDYQGQGEALIGWLDAHWESKKITTPEKFKKHFSSTVPLLLIDKYVWENNETFLAKMQISHHAEGNLYSDVSWNISDETGNTYVEGKLEKQNFKNGELSDLGNIEFDLSMIKNATKLIVSIKVDGSAFQNEWPIWVYPKSTPTLKNENVIITNELDIETLEKLKAGANVLLQAHQLGTKESSVKALFYPLYWSLTFFPGQGKTNIGLLLDEELPAFNDFPTEFHSNWQWESISSDAKGFILNELPHHYRPTAQPIDDFHRNNKVGSIFELKVGDGKLLVCGYNLEADKAAAKQLKFSLLKYMNSAYFNPSQIVSDNWLKKTFKLIPEVEKAVLPKEFDNAILYVDAAVNLQVEKQNIPWKKEFDKIQIAENVTYEVSSIKCWKDGEHSIWAGSEMEIQINCPEGMLGTLLVSFNDYNNMGRSGFINFEGRESKIGTHSGDEFLVKFHVMREDSNDGKLILKTQIDTGGNLMINSIVLIKEL